MDWIDFIYPRTYFHYDAERRSEAVLFKRDQWAGIKDCSHGIHPVGNRSHKQQVSSEMTQRQSIIGSTFFDRFKTVFGPSLTGFLSLTLFHPRLKSRVIFGRPFRDFWYVAISVGQPVRPTCIIVLVEKRGLA